MTEADGRRAVGRIVRASAPGPQEPSDRPNRFRTLAYEGGGRPAKYRTLLWTWTHHAGLRHLTRGWRRLPDFLVIGAQKSGTTALFRWLVAHPDAAPSLVKEIHFFDLNWHRGVEWYRASLPMHLERTSRRMTFEATPAYLFHPLVPARVRALLPGVRLIAVLRNPVDRAYSHYHMERRHARENLSFEEALEREDERLQPHIERLQRDPIHRARDLLTFSYCARGRYAEQLRRWLALFPREQLLVVSASALHADPDGSFARVQEFLGLRRAALRTQVHHAVQRYPPMAPATRERLLEEFRPHNQELYRLIGTTFDWDR